MLYKQGSAVRFNTLKGSISDRRIAGPWIRAHSQHLPGTCEMGFWRSGKATSLAPANLQVPWVPIDMDLMIGNTHPYPKLSGWSCSQDHLSQPCSYQLVCFCNPHGFSKFLLFSLQARMIVLALCCSSPLLCLREVAIPALGFPKGLWLFSLSSLK